MHFLSRAIQYTEWNQAFSYVTNYPHIVAFVLLVNMMQAQLHASYMLCACKF